MTIVRGDRRPLASLALALLCAGLGACGSTTTRGTTGSVSRAATTDTSPGALAAERAEERPAPAPTPADADKDNDRGVPGEDANNDSVLDFGHEADASDRRAITALIERYYTAAETENGTAACSMIYTPLAEAIVGDYSQTPSGPIYMRGATTCPKAMTLLFEHFHAPLAVELPGLKVARVRLEAHHGLAVLSFGRRLPERQILVIREGRAWRISTLLDSELP